MGRGNEEGERNKEEENEVRQYHIAFPNHENDSLKRSDSQASDGGAYVVVRR